MKKSLEDISSIKIIGNEKVLIYIGFFTIAVLIPLVFNSLYNRIYLLSSVQILLLVTIVTNMICFVRYRKFPIKIFHIIVIIGVAILITKHYIGTNGIVFAYPLVVFAYFTVNRSISNRFAIAFTLSLTLHSFLIQDYALGLRLALSISFMALYLNYLVSQIVELKQKLVDASNMDPLTQSYNRRYLDQVIGELDDEDVRSNAKASLLMIDADHFKSINDRFGHDVGDRVLIDIAEAIRGQSRSEDFLFRYGGEEFVLLAKHMSAQDAFALAERIRGHISMLTLPDGSRISVSIGVAEYSRNDIIQDVLKRADTQLYAAKTAGRNRVCIDDIAALPQSV